MHPLVLYGTIIAVFPAGIISADLQPLLEDYLQPSEVFSSSRSRVVPEHVYSYVEVETPFYHYQVYAPAFKDPAVINPLTPDAQSAEDDFTSKYDGSMVVSNFDYKSGRENSFIVPKSSFRSGSFSEDPYRRRNSYGYTSTYPHVHEYDFDTTQNSQLQPYTPTFQEIKPTYNENPTDELFSTYSLRNNIQSYPFQESFERHPHTPSHQPQSTPSSYGSHRVPNDPNSTPTTLSTSSPNIIRNYVPVETIPNSNLQSTFQSNLGQPASGTERKFYPLNFIPSPNIIRDDASRSTIASIFQGKSYSLGPSDQDRSSVFEPVRTPVLLGTSSPNIVRNEVQGANPFTKQEKSFPTGSTSATDSAAVLISSSPNIIRGEAPVNYPYFQPTPNSVLSSPSGPTASTESASNFPPVDGYSSTPLFNPKVTSDILSTTPFLQPSETLLQEDSTEHVPSTVPVIYEAPGHNAPS